MAHPTYDLVIRPPMHHLPQCSEPMMGNGDQYWSDTTESLDSLCMRYLQSSPGDSGHYGNHIQPSREYQMQPQLQGQAHLHPLPQSHSHHSRSSASNIPILPTPRFNGPPQQIYSNSPSSFNGRGILPSPTSRNILQSSTTNQNLLFSRSPYPLLPGLQCLPPLKPRSFTFSSMAQPGILV